MPASHLLEWVADWVEHDGSYLGKPTSTKSRMENSEDLQVLCSMKK